MRVERVEEDRVHPVGAHEQAPLEDICHGDQVATGEGWMDECSDESHLVFFVCPYWHSQDDSSFCQVTIFFEFDVDFTQRP